VLGGSEASAQAATASTEPASVGSRLPGWGNGFRAQGSRA
jgi:hypothetical protein